MAIWHVRMIVVGCWVFCSQGRSSYLSEEIRQHLPE